MFPIPILYFKYTKHKKFEDWLDPIFGLRGVIDTAETEFATSQANISANTT
jgi:hypothetical protein